MHTLLANLGILADFQQKYKELEVAGIQEQVKKLRFLQNALLDGNAVSLY